MSVPCLLEHMRDVAGQDVQPATLAEPKSNADEMIEGAIRELAAPSLDLRSRVIRPKGLSPMIRSRVKEGEAQDDDSGVILVDENNGAPVKIPKRKLKEWAVSMARLISHRSRIHIAKRA